jgi:hypothetical protein
MKNEVILSLVLLGLIMPSIFIILTPSIVAQQQNESNYSSTINESSYYPPIQDSKNETISQVNESINFTIIVNRITFHNKICLLKTF